MRPPEEVASLFNSGEALPREPELAAEADEMSVQLIDDCGTRTGASFYQPNLPINLRIPEWYSDDLLWSLL